MAPLDIRVWATGLLFIVITLINTTTVQAKADQIEEVNAKQLENLIQDSDYVAVFWFKRKHRDSERVLEELEEIDDDTDKFGLTFVKIVDKKFAKSYGVKTFPALSYFRNKEPIHYEGDLMDEAGVLQFLTSLEAMELPDQIEEVNAKILDKVVEDQTFVAVLFCPSPNTCKNEEYKNDCRKCVKVLTQLENVDDDADQLGIAFVKINDPDLADEYSLGSLPALVYYRHRVPVVYDGDLMHEEKVLEWMVANKNTGDDDDEIDDITGGLLNTLIDSMDHLAVIFYDRDEADDKQILHELENIDDELDKEGIHIVKICDDNVAKDYGIEHTPALVYFEHEISGMASDIPSLYDGDLLNEEEVLIWLVEQLNTDEIEDINDEMLDKLIREAHHLAVLFYDEEDPESLHVVGELENIDDECDAHGVSFVKIDNEDEAKEYGIESYPTLVYFESSVPSVYTGSLLAEDEVLDWLIAQVEGDEIEEVTDEMLDKLIERSEHLAVLFYDHDQRRSKKVIQELENIDDDCDTKGVMFVKIDSEDEAKEYGINELPTLVYFESEIPYIFQGDLMDEEEVLAWLIHHVESEEIAEVTDQMMDKLIINEPYLAVLFYDKGDKEDFEVLAELENIDDDCEMAGVPLVKIDNLKEAKGYGIDDFPTLVYFENRIPSIYEGDLSNEQEVLAWLLQQKMSDTIEEVTDEILGELIANFEYVVVYFSGVCEEGDECDKILKELENLDDDTDEQGMHFVTTEELEVAVKHSINKLPALALFRNGEPVIYEGSFDDSTAILDWLTSDDTLEIPNQIEEVNEKMLERLLNTSDNIAVFFYSNNDKKSRVILLELENIDDECDDIGVDFVKISDEDTAKTYDIIHLPALVYFRNRFPQIYEGDLRDEEMLLEWLIDNKDKGPESLIEEVDGSMLPSLVDSFEYLVVYFYDENCPTCETILTELETIDDETDEAGIQFVKTNDVEVAEELGISHLPALVYFESGVPSIYDAPAEKWSRHKKPSKKRLVTSSTVDLFDNGDFNDNDAGGASVFSSRRLLSIQEDDKPRKPKKSKKGDGNNLTNKIVNKVNKINKAVLAAEKDKKKKSDNTQDENVKKAKSDKSKETKSKDKKGDYKNKKIDKKIDDEKKRTDTNEKKTKENDKGKTTELKIKVTNKNKNKDEKTNDKDGDKVDKIKVDKNKSTEPKEKKIIKNKADKEKIDDDEIHKKCKVKNEVKTKKKSNAIKGNKALDKEDKKEKKVSGKKIDNNEDKKPASKKNKKPGDIKEKKVDDKKMKKIDHNKEKKPPTKKEKKPDYIKEDKSADKKDEKSDAAKEKKIDDKKKEKPAAKNEKKEKADDEDDDDDNEEAEEEEEEEEKKVNIKKLKKTDGKDKKKPAAKNEKRADDEDDDDNDEEEVEEEKEEKKVNDKKLKKTDGKDKKRADGDDGKEEKKVNDKKQKQDGNKEENKLKDKKENKTDNKKQKKVIDKKEKKVEDKKEMKAENKKQNKADDKNKGESDKQKVKTKKETKNKINEKDDQKVDKKKEVKAFKEKQSKVKDKKSNKIDASKTKENRLAKEVTKKKTTKNKVTKNKKDIKKTKDKRKTKHVHDAASGADITEEGSVLEWLIEQRHEDTIENINRQMLYTLIDTSDYLAVYFFNEENPDCPKVLRVLEKIDDEAAEYGVQMVKMNDRLMAKKYGYRNPPGLVYFRKGKYIKYEGDMFDEEDILDWLTAPENMELNDAIEKVNRKMFERIRQTTDYLAVFFYTEKNCKQCEKVLTELENIDDEAEANGIDFVKIEDAKLAKEVGVFAIPAIVFYRAKVQQPIIYAGGDMKNEENLLSWLLTEKDPSADFIEDLSGDSLIKAIRDSDSVAVYFFKRSKCKCKEDELAEAPVPLVKKISVLIENEGNKEDEEDDVTDAEGACGECLKVLEELENIDDDTDRIGVKFVKTQDTKVAEKYGILTVPCLIYFEHGVPTLFEGDLLAEEEVLQWLTLQKTEDRIETINRNLLEVMVEETQYLAVFFYKPNCRACEIVLGELENIDDECDVYGIQMVKIQDPQLAKRYGIKTLPALIYFRNGNPLIFDGDIEITEMVTDWLTDEEIRELPSYIDEVNAKMLQYYIANKLGVAVFFFDEENCDDSDAVLQELENIDDEVDMFGIDFVKIKDPDAAAKFNIIHTPALVYFRKKTPLVYDGDLLDEEKVFSWLTSQDVFEIKDEIEEVNRKMLEKLLDENDFVAVYFYDNECPECDEVLERLENIDDETDGLDITFVKIKDARYAKKYGMQKVPALVYFRRRFPSIYRGDLMVEEEVLDWLQKNRFKQPELNVFMYATGAITLAFIMYTLFLIFCFKGPHQKTA